MQNIPDKRFFLLYAVKEFPARIKTRIIRLAILRNVTQRAVKRYADRNSLRFRSCLQAKKKSFDATREQLFCINAAIKVQFESQSTWHINEFTFDLALIPSEQERPHLAPNGN